MCRFPRSSPSSESFKTRIWWIWSSACFWTRAPRIRTSWWWSSLSFSVLKRAYFLACVRDLQSFVLSLWKYLAKIEIRRIRSELIRMGDPAVVTKRVPAASEMAPLSKWEIEQREATPSKGIGSHCFSDRIEPSNQPAALPEGDYKRRRQSYRAKMTHLTKRTTIQEHRDFINMRMQMLAEEEGYRLIGKVDRVTTKTTPQEIEREMRKKRWRLLAWLTGRVTPKELQFRNPLDARNDMRRKLRERRRNWNVCWETHLRNNRGIYQTIHNQKRVGQTVTFLTVGSQWDGAINTIMKINDCVEE